MLTALYTVFVFCVIIFTHELGHFITAKLTGITVHEFAIGMGPKLYSFQGKKTDYSLRLFPIGGYVRLEGEDEISDDENAFCNKKPWQRFIVLVAGALMNFVLGFAIFVILFSLSSGISTNKIGNIIENSAFEKAGVNVNDKIIYMKNSDYKSKISDYKDILFFLSRTDDSGVEFTFERNGRSFTKTIFPEAMEDDESEIYGFKPVVEKKTVFNVFGAAYRQSKFVIKLVFTSFADMFKGHITISDFSGPVGIVNEIGNAAADGMNESFLQGLLNVMSLAALISINLGVVNLLPLPALDGGRIVFVIIEIILGKPIDREKEGIFHFIGFVLLILLMIVITFSDVKRLLM